MAKKWDKSLKTIDFNQLKTILDGSGLQTTNNPAYQVIWQLIRNAQQNKDVTEEEIKTIIAELNELINLVTNISTGLQNLDYITSKNDFPTLPNSRQLLPGTGITFDDSIAHQRTVNSTGGGGSGGSSGFSVYDSLESTNDDYNLIPPSSSQPGPTGATGSTGPAGIPGPSGMDGFDGEDGLPGIAGTSGPQGIQGPTGLQGQYPITIDPIDGEDGWPGIPGPSGSAGIQGIQGNAGTAGIDGIDGEDGWPIVGATGITGAIGSSGKDGIQPDVLIALDARILRRLRFLEQAAGADYKTEDLGFDPTDQELLDIEIDGLVPTSGTVGVVDSFGITIDGGGSVFSTGFKGVRPINYSGIITSISLYAADNLTGSVVIDIWKVINSNPLMTSANSIVGANIPTISSGNSYISTALNGTAFNIGDIFGFNVNSVSTLTRVVLMVNVLKNVKLF